LKKIEGLIKNKEVYEVTMQNQEEVYQKVAKTLGNKTCVVPFTGDVNFSESEVVDRLIEIFGDLQIIPGISSIQVAASNAKIPLDKSKVITMHVHVFEFLTSDKETHFIGTLKDLEGKQFSDLSVMVFDQTKLESYVNF